MFQIDSRTTENGTVIDRLNLESVQFDSIDNSKQRWTSNNIK